MNKNIRYINYKDEAERSRLIEEYQMYGYYVTESNGRILVNSKWPKKVEKKGRDNKRKFSRKVDKPANS